MKFRLPLFLLLLLAACGEPEETVILRYGNGEPKVTYEIRKGTEDDPIDFYYRAYYQNGNKMKEGWMRGRKEQDDWLYYSENGKLSSKGHYVDGHRTGPFTRYYDTGEIEQKGQYLNDSIVSCEFYNRNGTKKSAQRDFAELYKDSVTPWTQAQFETVLRRTTRDFNSYTPKIPAVAVGQLVTFSSKHIEYAAFDTLPDFDRGAVFSMLLFKMADDSLHRAAAKRP